MKSRLLSFAIAIFACGHAFATEATPARRNIAYQGPIIDVHLHTDPPTNALGMPNPVTGAKAASSAAELRDATLAQLKLYNVVLGVLNGWPGTLESWAAADSKRFLLAPMILQENRKPVLSATQLRQLLKDGKASLVGEIMGQYMGLRPDDAVLDDYWRLAEEMDVPVMIHMGTSFPGTAYAGYPSFRLVLGNPLLLEEVLVRHPKLRVWIAHGGEPWTQETFALMQQYPQVYVDVSTISWIAGVAGRPGFHAFLKQAVARGLGKRILFGSDQMAWPDAIGLAIEGVDSADFLSNEQKRDIFYANAVRFLRLQE